MPVPQNQRRLFLFSAPRTTSNLLVRLLSQHPDIEEYPYPFMYAWMFGPERLMVPPKEARMDVIQILEKQHRNLTFQSRLDEMQKFIAKTEKEGKIPLIKEHSLHLMLNEIFFSGRKVAAPSLIDHELDAPATRKEAESASPHTQNPTILSDRFLRTLTPVFIIRHPARVVPSYQRAAGAYGLRVTDEHFEGAISYRWSRLIFDYYNAHYSSQQVNGSTEESSEADVGTKHGLRPIVIDADDLVDHTEELMLKICKLIGLDPSHIRYEWQPQVEPQPQVMEAFLGTIRRSSGVIRDAKPLKPPVVEDAAERWREEFGDQCASAMTEFVKNEMSDYEYLQQFRLKVA